MTAAEPTPLTVFTGFLGAGKTTLLISLLKRLPSNYKVAVLKNEYGDVKVDSALAAQSNSNLAGVTEMLNGCLCCVLTGQMREAVLEIQDKYNPDRILIETSGSAFPATLSIQLRDLAKELKAEGAGRGVRLDGIINVIDAENFIGYADTSKTASVQAQYTDLIVFNKWEGVSERQFDIVWDRVNDLNTDTPKIKSNNGAIPWEAIMGLDTKLGLSLLEYQIVQDHSHDNIHSHEDHLSEIETLTVSFPKANLNGDELSKFFVYLDQAPKDEIYRMKFIIRVSPLLLPVKISYSSSSPKPYILNWAFGRYEFTEISEDHASQLIDDSLCAVGTVMVGRGDGRRFKKRLESGILGEDVSIVL
ncbi:CobW/HypB/UreG, nucleotide-binding domain-containing protein [Lipomyces oligophaga]|uniref:CobW/HypB/UreG, nucleotide-binding domain-containing protein n=1 Tax=Lipomyces oligophaga TaxID=45792 RepID=UPI0034CEF5A7